MILLKMVPFVVNIHSIVVQQSLVASIILINLFQLEDTVVFKNHGEQIVQRMVASILMIIRMSLEVLIIKFQNEFIFNS
jgi:hypothetical protein